MSTTPTTTTSSSTSATPATSSSTSATPATSSSTSATPITSGSTSATPTTTSTARNTYRVYSYDGVHKVLTADLIEAETDEEALREAEAMGFGTKCEIWEGNRLVAEIGSERLSA